MLQRFPRNRAARQFTTAATGAWNDTFFGDTKRHGFLPSQKPVGKLPTEFDVLENILQKMTCIQPDGTRSGLLAHNELGKTVDSDFPDLMHEIQKVDDSDQRMLAALFRDYSFLSSAYMLEPSHVHYLKTGNYGQANCTLPEKLAVPMQTIANKLHYGKPLLEYGYGYALGNWKLLNDPNPEELSYENKDILPPSGTKLKEHISNVRLFNGCTDEAGFILVHVAIITQTNRQISSYDIMFDGAFKKNRELFNQGMQNHLVPVRAARVQAFHSSRPDRLVQGAEQGQQHERVRSSGQLLELPYVVQRACHLPLPQTALEHGPEVDHRQHQVPLRDRWHAHHHLAAQSDGRLSRDVP